MEQHVHIAGGGAAGFFAAIALAEQFPGVRISILEKGPVFLSKVKISGGGRCNVTHACFEPKALSAYYPRGGKALLGPFHRFQPRDTIEWFKARGVRLKIEPDGRIFPSTDSSQTIVDCLIHSARDAGISLRSGCGVAAARKGLTGRFELDFTTGERAQCDCLLLATGGCRSVAGGELAVSLGHTLETPVPSLFSFQIHASWLSELAGIALEVADVSVPGDGLDALGPMLITHAGLSGPAILKLSAWGARVMHSVDYKFPLHVDWLPRESQEGLRVRLARLRAGQAARRVLSTSLAPLPARLWKALLAQAQVSAETRWAALSRAAEHRLVRMLKSTVLQVAGKSLNRDEFVTCGGVPLPEVDFKTMASKRCPGLYFAGELLDIDGLTGGFNFQAAWTTGWIAGQAIARAIHA